jgi:hypothetical protein
MTVWSLTFPPILSVFARGGTVGSTRCARRSMASAVDTLFGTSVRAVVATTRRSNMTKGVALLICGVVSK